MVNGKIVGFVCPKHGYVNCEKYGFAYCPECGEERKLSTKTNGETFYERGLGMEVNSRDIDKICKERGLVYGGDDLSKEAARNRVYNEQKFKQEFYGGLRKELEKGF